MTKEERDSHSGTPPTGHEWDGTKELDTPLPRWWVIVFYATIVWAIAYWVFMQSWPGITGYFKGVRQHSDRVNVARDLEAQRSDHANYAEQLRGLSLAQIEEDPKLLNFALDAGRATFGDNCATCHGAGGQGAVGYPDLADDDWLWGGTLPDIRCTLEVGLRSTSPQTRAKTMPAFGRDKILSPAEIAGMVEYVISLAGGSADAAAAARSAPIVSAQCSACHGPAGTGDHAQGAPNLTDKIWLFGGDRTSIQTTITNPHAGVMPSWGGRLDPLTLDSLAVYVHSLGGGQ
jgi:cytochrome c oxidase cbb3-type subunit 3